MIWRAAAVLVVVFWTVMSGLLLRDVYFPEASRFAIIPPRVVVDLFLRQSDAFGSTLHLYHQREKIGHASFQITRRSKAGEQPVYDVLLRGVADEAVPEKHARRVTATWNISCTLADAERWEHLSVAAELPAQDVSLKLVWDQQDAAPEVLVKQGGRVMVNSQDVQMLMKLGAGKDGAMAMLSMLGGGLAGKGAGVAAMQPGSLRLTAREGVMSLAGRDRKCFVLVLPLLGQQEVKMLFTEAGELARIELPDDYVFLEPAIHGLQN